MTAPVLPLLPSGAPPSASSGAAPSQPGAEPAVSDHREPPAFSRVLADQHRGQKAAASSSSSASERPAGSGQRPARPGKGHAERAADKEAGPAPTLAQQALDIAIQATAQLRGADRHPGATRDARTPAADAAGRTAESSREHRTARPGATAAHARHDPADGRDGIRGREHSQAPSRELPSDTAAIATAASDARPDAAAAASRPAVSSAHIGPAGASPGRGSSRTLAKATDILPRGPVNGAAEVASGKAASRSEPGDPSAQPLPQLAAAPDSSAAHAAAGSALMAAAAATAGPSSPADAPAERPAVAVMQVATPLHQPQWGADLGRQLVALGQSADGQRHTAELRLDPPDLGPLRVSLQISDGIAQASFVSPHAAVRHAIESAMPQLQQSLAQAGISLGQASVGDQRSRQDWGQPQGGQRNRAESNDGDFAIARTGEAPAARAATNALVDTFA